MVELNACRGVKGGLLGMGGDGQNRCARGIGLFLGSRHQKWRGGAHIQCTALFDRDCSVCSVGTTRRVCQTCSLRWGQIIGSEYAHAATVI